MISTDKTLLHNIIDSLPQNEFDIIYRMFSSFIEDYLDSHLTNEEYAEYLQTLEGINNGEYVKLADLPD